MKLIAAVVLMLAAGIGGAFAQAFPNYPTLGVPADTQCLAYGNAGRCTQFRPAGPTALTGNETVPADTNLTGGQNPQTIRIPITSMNAGPYQYVAPLTGASIAVPNTTRQLVLEPAGTIATLTVTFPAATTLSDNQRIGLCSTQVVTALTLTAGTGTTILNGVTALAVPPATGAGTCYEWLYRSANTSWYRVQ